MNREMRQNFGWILIHGLAPKIVVPLLLANPTSYSRLPPGQMAHTTPPGVDLAARSIRLARPSASRSIGHPVTSLGRGKYSRRDIGWAEKISDRLWRAMKLKPLTPTSYTAEMEDIISEKPWLVYLSATTLAFCTVVSALYCLGRGYILVEDVIGLRELPNSTFETVAWTGYLPRI